MTVYLLRHGKTEAGERHLYCGSSDLPLSEEGVRALEARERKGLYPELDGLRVVTSGMRRCEQTLFVLYGYVPHETDPALREMDFGDFEMRSYAQLCDEPAYQDWISGDNEAKRAPGGESGNEMKARALAAFRALTAAGTDLLLVTHGGVIAAIMASLFPEEGKNRYEWQPAAGEGYRLSLGRQNSYSAL